jgi:hypothetical protein
MSPTFTPRSALSCAEPGRIVLHAEEYSSGPTTVEITKGTVSNWNQDAEAVFPRTVIDSERAYVWDQEMEALWIPKTGGSVSGGSDPGRWRSFKPRDEDTKLMKVRRKGSMRLYWSYHDSTSRTEVLLKQTDEARVILQDRSLGYTFTPARAVSESSGQEDQTGSVYRSGKVEKQERMGGDWRDRARQTE